MFAAEFEGRPLTDDEITRMMMSLILGGVTATADQITNIIWRLAVYPELQERLYAEPEMLPHAIEEFLRIEPSATGAGRVCTRDTVLGGKDIKKGEQLIVHLSAANRDPAVFENPDEVNLDREKIPHVTFGMGHHRCLGSNFARLNIRVVMREVLTRMRNIRLVEDDPPRRVADMGWMVTHLPVTFDPSARLG
jgi:cytochrome P450